MTLVHSGQEACVPTHPADNKSVKSESEGADWLSDAHDEALDFLDRKYPDESEAS